MSNIYNQSILDKDFNTISKTSQQQYNLLNPNSDSIHSYDFRTTRLKKEVIKLNPGQGCDTFVSELSGQPFTKESFTHANMVPFFRIVNLLK